MLSLTGKDSTLSDRAIDLTWSSRVRMRRLRASESLRAMVRETHIRLEKLIYPLFVVEGSGIQKPISSMPNIYQQSIDVMLKEVEQVVESRLKAVILFGIPDQKDTEARGAWKSDGIVQKAIREIKKHFPDLLIVADTCLCEYMSHGHCGFVEND